MLLHQKEVINIETGKNIERLTMGYNEEDKTMDGFGYE